ncbi:MAG: hypothetical protein ACPGN3_07560 [Opitutales bacterium]
MKSALIRLKHFKSVIILSMGLMCGNQALAQNDEVNVEFSIILMSKTIFDIVYADSEPFNINHGLKSPKRSYSGSRKLTFYRLNRNKLDAEGNPTRVPIGSTRFPAKEGSFVLIFKPVEGKRRTFNIATIPDGQDIFKPGMYRFINTATFDIAIKIGEATSIVKANGFMDLDAKTVDSKVLDTVIISLVDQENPVRGYRGGLRFAEDRRYTYIISEKKMGRRGRVDLYGIPEKVVLAQ